MKTLETTPFFVEVIIVMLAVIKSKKQLSEGNLKRGFINIPALTAMFV